MSVHYTYDDTGPSITFLHDDGEWHEVRPTQTVQDDQRYHRIPRVAEVSEERAARMFEFVKRQAAVEPQKEEQRDQDQRTD